MEHILRTPEAAGSLLAAIRKASGHSQVETATDAGLRQPRLSFLERNGERATLRELMGVTSALGLELVVRQKAAPKKAVRKVGTEATAPV